MVTLSLDVLSLTVVLFSAIAVPHRVRADQGICDLSAGTWDENVGICTVCVDGVNCGCVLDTNSFVITCDSYCVDLANCGTASCQGGVTETLCQATVPVADSGTLRLSWTCSVAGACSCDQATWNDEDCAVCNASLGQPVEYDCTNVVDASGLVAGPCHNAGTCATDMGGTMAPTPAPLDLDRSYRTDASFRAKVASMTLPQASAAANIPIGAAIPDGDLGLKELAEFVPSHYNMVVGENLMKWNRLLVNETVYDEYNFTGADAMVSAAKSANAVVRGHVLIWGRSPGSTYPESVLTTVQASSDPQETLLEIMRNHIQAVTEHFQGSVDVWDVVNEHLTSQVDSNIFYTTFGDDYVRLSFELAREFLPDTKLVWNEALSEFGLDNPSIAWWIDTLQKYKEDGVPVDGIGVQGHTINNLHDTDQLATFLQAVADIGYDIELTEVDARFNTFLDQPDPFAAQGEYLKRYAEACIHTGRCKGIPFWGLSDRTTWLDWIFPLTKPNLPLLIDEEGYEKPAWLSVRTALEESVASTSSNSPVSAPTTTTITSSVSVYAQPWTLYHSLAAILVAFLVCE